MGTKYIVELEDGEHLYKTTINALGNPVMRSAEKAPYTEPSLEKVKKEAYEKGYESGFVVGHLKAEKSGQSFYEDGYNRGLADAWNAARKIVIGDINIIVSVFGTASRSIIIRDLAAAEVIEKLRAYEQEQDEKKKTDYYFEMMKDAIETSAKEYGMSLDEVAEVLESLRRQAACGLNKGGVA